MGFVFRSKWLWFFTLLTLLCGALTYLMLDIDNRLTPPKQLSEPANYDKNITKNAAIKGISRLMETARYADRGDNSIWCPVHILGDDKYDLKKHLTTIAPSMGWYIHDHSMGRIYVVMDEKSLDALGELADDPVGWVYKYQNNDQYIEPENDLVNVTIDLDGYYGRSVWFNILFVVFIIAGIICLIVSLGYLINVLDEV